MSDISRRHFLVGAGAGLAGMATATSAWARTATSARRPPLPAPDRSGIEHVVVLCMENRSYDHFLGWVPGGNGRQEGLSYLDDNGVPHPTHHLTEWQGCGFNDPDHSYEGGRVQLNGGACDGFRRGDNDDFAIGYYERADLPAMSALVDHFTVFDRWHCGILAPTYPNRFYTHAAATDRIENTMTTSTLPTIWDSLNGAGVPATYYFSDAPFLGLWGTKYLDIAKPIDTFFVDVASGQLPGYSYLDPFFLGEGQGGSNDDHPHADIRRGQALISNVVQALTTGPLWSKTVFILTYDEWGGFFDHVRPPALPDAFVPTETEEHNTTGFRVPTFVVSPFASKGKVAHGVYDHSSILKFVEWRWGLTPLTPRDAASANLATALDFTAPNLVPPEIHAVADPGPHLCGAPDVGMATDESMWQELMSLPVMRSWEAIA